MGEQGTRIPSGKAALAAGPRAVLGKAALLPGRKGASASSQPCTLQGPGVPCCKASSGSSAKALALLAMPGPATTSLTRRGCSGRGEMSPPLLTGLSSLPLMGIKTVKA